MLAAFGRAVVVLAKTHAHETRGFVKTDRTLVRFAHLEVAAVSYTHLDVYKRQVKPHGENLGFEPGALGHLVDQIDVEADVLA